MKAILIFAFSLLIVFSSCSKKDSTTTTTTHPAPMLIFKFKFDSTQQRLNNFGQPESLPAGHGGQSPIFNAMSAHYIELASDSFTPLGHGIILYKAAEVTTTDSFGTAIDFDKCTKAGQGGVFYSMPLSQVMAGTYKWLRVSLAYQNYDVSMRLDSPFTIDLTATVASFIGYNTHINSVKIKDSTLNVGANKPQGFWAFETSFAGTKYVSSGQAPPGATTVPNPIHISSPIPAGSCVVTGAFPTAFTITGNETSDVTIVVSVSTNKSFEWVEHSTPGYYEPAAGDTVVDMGVRGMIPIVQ